MVVIIVLRLCVLRILLIGLLVFFDLRLLIVVICLILITGTLGTAALEFGTAFILFSDAAVEFGELFFFG